MVRPCPLTHMLWPPHNTETTYERDDGLHPAHAYVAPTDFPPSMQWPEPGPLLLAGAAMTTTGATAATATTAATGAASSTGSWAT